MVLVGDDAGDFTIDGGVLTLQEVPRLREATTARRPGGYDLSNTYSVTVEATDEHQEDGDGARDRSRSPTWTRRGR